MNSIAFREIKTEGLKYQHPDLEETVLQDLLEQIHDAFLEVGEPELARLSTNTDPRTLQALAEEAANYPDIVAELTVVIAELQQPDQ